MRARTRKYSPAIAACLALLLAGLLPTSTPAQWIANGNPICGAFGEQSDIRITSDGEGGAVMVWADARAGLPTVTSIYANRIYSTGGAQWASDGIALCTNTSPMGFSSPCIVYDGGIFFFSAWVDSRNGNNDIYAAIIDSHGEIRTTPNGMPICTAVGDQTGVKLVYEPGEATAFATWTDTRNGNSDVFLKAFKRDQMYGPVDGATVYAGAGIQGGAVLCSDMAKGAIVVWQDDRNGNNDIYAQRVERNGVLHWPSSGVPICTQSAHQFAPIVVSDGAGGAIIAWQDNRNGAANPALYARRIDHSGNVLWATDGVPIRVAGDLMGNYRMIPDGQGGAILAWYDYRNRFTSGNDIFAQRVNGSGTPLWLANGVAACTAPGPQSSPDLATDGNGGAVIVWQDQRAPASPPDLYAQHLDGLGSALWAANGVPICNDPGNQLNPAIVADGVQGTIIAFQDGRNTGTSTISDVFATRFTNSGLLGYPDPVLLSVVDVPDDYGGAVRATFRQGDGSFSGFQIERATVPPAFVPVGSVGGGGGPIFTVDVATTADLVNNTFRVVATTPQSQQVWSNWITTQSVNNHVCPGSTLFDTANGASLASPGAQYTLQALPQNWGVMAAWSPSLTADWALQASSTSFVPSPSCFSDVLATAPPAPVTYLAADLRATPGVTYGVSAQTPGPGPTGVLRWITPTDLTVDGYGFNWSGVLNYGTPIRVFRAYLYAGTRQVIEYTSSALQQPSWLRIFRNNTTGNAWFSPGNAILEVQGSLGSPGTPASFVVPATDWYLLVASMSANPISPEDFVEIHACGWQLLPTQQSVLKPPMSISGFPWKVEFEQTNSQSGVLACRVEAPGLGGASVGAGAAGVGCSMASQASCFPEFGKVGVLTANFTPGGLATGSFRAAIFHVYANPVQLRMEWDAGLGTMSVNGLPTTRSFTATDIVDAWDVELQSGTIYYFEFVADGTLDAKVCLNDGTGWDGRSTGGPPPEVESNGIPYPSYVATRSGPHTLYVVNDNGGAGSYSLRVSTTPAGGAWADTIGDAQVVLVYEPEPPGGSAGSGPGKAPTLAYVADGPAGVAVVDVSTPSNPTLLGGVAGFSGDAWDIRARGARAIALGSERLSSIDLNAGAVNGTYEWYGALAVDIDATNRVIVVTEDQVQLVDWTNPNSPFVVGSMDGGSGPKRVTFSSPVPTQAYVAAGTGGMLWILNTFPGSDPSLAAWCYVPGDANDVVVAGPYAYVACGSAGLAIVQLGGAYPVVSTFDTHGYATGVTVDGGTAYVSNGSGGIAIVDVSNPASPQPISFLPTASSANKVIVAGGHVFVADGSAGLLVLNQPAIPTGVPVPEPGPASALPTVYALSAYPNPLVGRATLSLATPRSTLVSLDVFDLAGRRVRRVFEGDVPAGTHPFAWDGSDGNGHRVAAGVYVVRANGPGLVLTRRVVVLR